MGQLRHVAYAGGWKKLEPMWDWVIRARQLGRMLPVLEGVLSGLQKARRGGKGNHLTRGLEALRRILGHRMQDKLVERRRHIEAA